MNRKEFISSIKTGYQREDVKRELTGVYNQNIPEEIVTILSMYVQSVFFDEEEIRTLSLREVLYAEADLDVLFKSIGLIPIVDLGDNDYIVFNCKTKEWGVYNILDQCIFQEAEEFDNLFMM